MNWFQQNIFHIIQFVFVIASFAYGYGILNSKVDTNANRVDEIKTRVVVLETKNDQLATLLVICNQNTTGIEELRKIVSADHDLIIRLASGGK